MSRPPFTTMLSRLYLLVFLILITPIAQASLNKNLWPKWLVHNPLSQAVISHREWQEFLTQCVSTNEEGINLVDYPHLTEAQLNMLKHYISHMSHISIKEYNRQEQLAYWINLYNALAVQTIALHYPVASIQEINISPGLFNIGPWSANLITIDGSRLSLDEIQNNILRAIWNDPRIHYALNDAAIGAANLSKHAYQGYTIDKQLNEAANEYVNSLRGIQVIEGKLVASKIYKWYLTDFGVNDADLIYHLSQYANEPLRNQLKQIHSVNSYIYNWHLNSTIDSSL